MQTATTTAYRLIALFAAVLLSLWIGIRAAEPPRALPADAPASAFSAMRALPDVHAIAQRPHPTASADNARVRAWLERRLTALGLRVEERRYLIDPEGVATLRRWTGNEHGGGEMADVVGLLPGRDPKPPALALMAHYDTVWGSPGGGDDSAGVAAVLETVRAIRARGAPARDIVVLFTDGEEIGLSGARAFWPADGVANHVGVVVNLEARGAGGRATMFETGDGNGAMMRLFRDSVARPVANSLSVLAYRMMPNTTDFTVVRARGLSGFNISFVGRPQYYHSPRATADRLDPRSLQDMGDQVLDVASALAFAPVLPGRAADTVFFDPAGRRLLLYAPAAGWLVLLVAAAALGGAWVRVRPRWAELGWGAAAQVAMLLGGYLLLAALNRISAVGHGNYFDRLAALPGLEAIAALGGLAAWIAAAQLRRAPIRLGGILPALALAVLARGAGLPLGQVLGCAIPLGLIGWFAPVEGIGRWGGWLGAIGLLLLAAIVVQAKAPMAAWLLAWPALIAAASALLVAWTDREQHWPWGWAITAAGATLVGALLLPVAHLVMLGLGARTMPIAIVLLAILAPAFQPLARIARPNRWTLLAAAALAVAALAVTLQVRTAPVSPTIPAYAPDK